MRQQGRRITVVPDGTKATLGIRARPALKQLLVEASRRNGASLSEECCRRLEASFIYEAAFADRDHRDKNGWTLEAACEWDLAHRAWEKTHGGK
jgi:hypothetical protein